MYDETVCFMEQLIEDGVIPGVSYAFIEDGKVSKGYLGNKQVYPIKTVITSNTLYDMASLTKVICTNSIILQLVETGQIELDSPLHCYLPEWEDETVTIRHLLTHTSGVNPYIKNRHNLTRDDLKKALLTLKTDSQIGTKVAYTDTGTILLGFLIERFYDKPVQDVFEHDVLNLLGMDNSHFTLSDKQQAAPTELTDKRGLIQGEVHDPKAFVLGAHCGSAGLFSTLDDTITFTQMMLNLGKTSNGDLFLKEATVLSLLEDQTPTKNLGRSLGWDLIESNHVSLFHTGYTGTFIILDIIKQTAFIFLSNRVHPKDNREDYLKKRDELISLYQKEQTNT